jgi:uncharacterized DUF497 family protein
MKIKLISTLSPDFLGQINSKNYTAIITYRDKNIRIISVRRSREKESKLYESIRTR